LVFDEIHCLTFRDILTLFQNIHRVIEYNLKYPCCCLTWLLSW